MSVRIKICGVRSAEDLSLCAAAGVDYVGFNFYPGSKRVVAMEFARELMQLLPQRVQAVGVFVNASPHDVASICARTGIGIAQLHGDEDLSDYSTLAVKLIQVIKVGPESTLDSLPVPRTRPTLFDARVEGYGGQGTSFDASLVAAAQARWGVPLLLAGGLTPLNVAAAIRIGHPWGVDVASGVERAPGIKDEDLLRAFVAAVRGSGETHVQQP